MFGLDIPIEYAKIENATGLRGFLQQVDGDLLLVELATKVLNYVGIKSSVCVACWLGGRVGGGMHVWKDCPHTKAVLNDVKLFKGGVKSASLPNGRHFHCFLPSRAPNHGVVYNMSQSCKWQDVVKDVLVVGVHEPRLRGIFKVYGVEHERRCDFRELGKALVRQKDPVFRENLLALWVQIVVWVMLSSEV